MAWCELRSSAKTRSSGLHGWAADSATEGTRPGRPPWRSRMAQRLCGIDCSTASSSLSATMVDTDTMARGSVRTADGAKLRR